MSLDEQFAVVMPTKNRASAVRQKAQWILRQPEVAQLIVVVDGSTDDTVDRLAEITDPRLDVIVQAKSTGTPGAKNAALGRVSTPWVATLDDDDKHSDGFLQELQKVAIEEGADVVCAPWLNVPVGVTPADAFAAATRSPRGPLPGRPGLVPASSFVETVWGPSNFVFRRRVLDAGVRFDERFRYNFWREETAFLVSAARAGFRVGSSNKAYSYVSMRTPGGIDRRYLVYEIWTVLNDLKFMLRHGAWMVSNGYVDSRVTFVLGNAGSRARGRLAPVLHRLRRKRNVP